MLHDVYVRRTYITSESKYGFMIKLLGTEYLGPTTKIQPYWIMFVAKEITFILLILYCIVVSEGSLNDYDNQVNSIMLLPITMENISLETFPGR